MRCFLVIHCVFTLIALLIKKSPRHATAALPKLVCSECAIRWVTLNPNTIYWNSCTIEIKGKTGCDVKLHGVLQFSNALARQSSQTKKHSTATTSLGTRTSNVLCALCVILGVSQLAWNKGIHCETNSSVQNVSAWTGLLHRSRQRHHTDEDKGTKPWTGYTEPWKSYSWPDLDPLR